MQRAGRRGHRHAAAPRHVPETDRHRSRSRSAAWRQLECKRSRGPAANVKAFPAVIDDGSLSRVRQNIELPLRLGGRRPRRSSVREIAARVGLDKRLRDRPSQLSGGQQQRVAIARALITRPQVMFADEPTGALDTRTGQEVLTLLREIVDRDRHTVVMVTHDPVAAAFADRVLLLADGRVAGTLEAPTAADVAARLARLGG